MSLTIPTGLPKATMTKRPAIATCSEVSNVEPSARVKSAPKTAPTIAIAEVPPKPDFIDRLMKGYWWKCPLANVALVGGAFFAGGLPQAIYYGPVGTTIIWASVALIVLVNLPWFLSLAMGGGGSVNDIGAAASGAADLHDKMNHTPQYDHYGDTRVKRRGKVW